jgi:hypothetical protein
LIANPTSADAILKCLLLSSRFALKLPPGKGWGPARNSIWQHDKSAGRLAGTFANFNAHINDKGF